MFILLQYLKVQSCTNCAKSGTCLKISRRQKSDIEKIPYWAPTNIRRHRTKFSRHGALAPGIRIPLTTFILATRAMLILLSMFKVLAGSR